MWCLWCGRRGGISVVFCETFVLIGSVDVEVGCFHIEEGLQS
jgi:hypothetical protein